MEKITYININQNVSCIAVGTNKGFYVYTLNPTFKLAYKILEVLSSTYKDFFLLFNKS